MSFISNRINHVVHERSSLLFEDAEEKREKTNPSPIPFSKDLLKRKRIFHEVDQLNKSKNEEEDSSKRLNATIPTIRSTLSSDLNTTVASALHSVGITEEEDKMNTSEVRHIIENFDGHQPTESNDVSLQCLLDSILEDNNSVGNASSSSLSICRELLP